MPLSPDVKVELDQNFKLDNIEVSSAYLLALVLHTITTLNEVDEQEFDSLKRPYVVTAFLEVMKLCKQAFVNGGDSYSNSQLIADFFISASGNGYTTYDLEQILLLAAAPPTWDKLLNKDPATAFSVISNMYWRQVSNYDLRQS